MKSIYTFLLLAALSLSACKESQNAASGGITTPKKGLVELAGDNSKDRVTRDAQGNVIELDLRGVPLSDQFVESLLAPELKTLQKFAVSGQSITDQTINRLASSEPYPIYREIVFEDVSIESPDDHPWVKDYRAHHTGTKLIFTKKGGQGDSDKPSN